MGIYEMLGRRRGASFSWRRQLSPLLALVLLGWALWRLLPPVRRPAARAVAAASRKPPAERRRRLALPARAALVLVLLVFAAFAMAGDGGLSAGGATSSAQGTSILSGSHSGASVAPAPQLVDSFLLGAALSLAAGDNLPALEPPDIETEPDSLPQPLAVSPDFLALEEILRQEIEAYRQREGRIDVAIAVSDLQTDETIAVNGSVPHRTGCTINLFALLVATEAFQNGEARPDDVAYLIRSGIGGSYPPHVKRFLQAIKGSHEAGIQRAQALMQAWGLQVSRFDHVPYYGDNRQDNLLTALETNLILTKLYRGELFMPLWTQYALERLRDVQPYLNYMLPKWLPASATVAHKIGYYWDSDGWVNNDAGIVTFAGADGQERAYVVTYLSQQARTEYNGYSFGAHLSKIVWDYFAAKYGGVTPSAPPQAPTPWQPTSAQAAPTPTPEPMPSPNPEPSPTPEATPTPEPSPTPTLEATPEPQPTPTSQPEPTSEATPTPAAISFDVGWLQDR